MRIGTWNLAGRWDRRHEELMRRQNCEVWLLTEVSERLSFDGYVKHAAAACMARGRRWAAILSHGKLVGKADPHPASAIAKVGNLHFCSSILPWRSCPSRVPWVGTTHAEKTKAALDELLTKLPQSGLIWGGDWNHALSGREFAGSQNGRGYLLNAVAACGLHVPTADLPHRLPNLLTIDHIAVPARAKIISAERVEAKEGNRELSDHDAYVVDVVVD